MNRSQGTRMGLMHFLMAPKALTFSQQSCNSSSTQKKSLKSSCLTTTQKIETHSAIKSLLIKLINYFWVFFFSSTQITVRGMIFSMTKIISRKKSLFPCLCFVFHHLCTYHCSLLRIITQIKLKKCSRDRWRLIRKNFVFLRWFSSVVEIELLKTGVAGDSSGWELPTRQKDRESLMFCS